MHTQSIVTKNSIDCKNGTIVNSWKVLLLLIIFKFYLNSHVFSFLSSFSPRRITKICSKKMTSSLFTRLYHWWPHLSYLIQHQSKSGLDYWYILENIIIQLFYNHNYYFNASCNYKKNYWDVFLVQAGVEFELAPNYFLFISNSSLIGSLYSLATI